MPSEFFDETLHLGLITARDAAFIPKGALQRADNARYHPGDFAIFPAEGRVKCGPSGSLDHSDTVIRQMVGIEWDEGTEVVAGLEGEYRQILYSIQAIGTVGLYTIVASEDPSHPDLDQLNKRFLGGKVGSGPMSAVQFDNDWYVFTGGPVQVLEREVGKGTAVLRHGMPINNIRSRVTVQGAGPAPNGVWWYWLAWVNDSGRNPIEGSSDTWKVDQDLNDEALQLQSVLNGPIPIYSNATLYVLESDWLASKPPEATRLYIYRGRTSRMGSGTSNPVGATPWPVGYRIFDLSIADIEAAGTVMLTTSIAAVADVGTPDGRGPYFLLAQDTFGVTNSFTREAALLEPPFPQVVIRIDSEEFPLGRAGEPPRASVGAVYNESMVTDDLDDRGKTRFSAPNRPHQFPEQFFINHRTGEFDEIVAYVGLGRIMGVYLTNGVERINFLPSNTDFNFRAGRLADQVLEMYGAVNGKAVVKFTHPAGRVMIAHVARNGIWVSDLFPEGTFEVTRNINWKALVGNPNNLHSAQLVNDPDEDRLIFFYNPSGGVAPDRMLFLHYDIAHLNEDQSFSITGPVMRKGSVYASALVTLDGGTRQVVTTDVSGRLLYEKHGWSDGADTGTLTPMDVLTREIYVAGITQQFDNEVMGVHTVPSGAGGNTTVKLVATPSGVPKEKLVAPDRDLVLLNLGGKAEAVQVQVVGDPVTGLTGVGVNVLTMSFNPLGIANRRSKPVGS